MKTKFTINREIFLRDGTLNDMFAHYEECYKEEGWKINKEEEEVYMIFDNEINLNEGDRVNIFGIRIVEWKCIDLINEIIEYSLELD